MSVQTSDLDRPPRRGSAGDLCAPDVVDLLDGIMSSAEPAVVFLSATQLCAPQICVSAVAAVSEAGKRAYRVASPREQTRPQPVGAVTGLRNVVAFGGIDVSPDSVVTELCGPATALHSAYDGVLVMTFDRPASTDRLLGRLIVDRAVSLVTIERLHDLAEMHRAQVANLEAALRSSRDVGMALGIIMNRHRLTERRAFELLRVCSQDTQRKVRDLAADIVYSGALDALGPVLTRCGGDLS